jgi:LysM repeat protein
MRRRRSPARWLAPIALVACAVAVYSVVNSNLLSDDEPASTSNASRSATATTSTTSKRSKTSSGRRRRTYVVKSGDTLSAISIKTGVPLARIQALNPKLDSDSLQTGQRVKLSP